MMQTAEKIEPIPYHPHSRLDWVDWLPFVIYECTPSWKLTYVSPNVVEILGFTAHEILAQGLPLSQKVFEYDLDLFQQRLDAVKRHGSANLIHRFLDRRGLPIWVDHRLQKCPAQDLIRGCFLQLPDDLRFQDCCHGAVKPFVHKLANHFTLLQLVVNSLRKGIPRSREAEVLYETISCAVDLMRGFAEYHEQPDHGSGRVRFMEILDDALMRIKCAAFEKAVAWEECIDESAQNVSFKGDPFLLESVFVRILQNAIEASAAGDPIMIRAEAYSAPPSGTRIKICIDDFGVGIDPEHLSSVFQPFFTTKPHHQGLGLAIARRYVEIHGGFLRLTSVLGEGTKAEINLPADTTEIDLRNTD